MANVVISAVTTYNGKGLAKGKKEISAFDKSVKKLGKTFATVFAARALLAFSKKAVTAFAADQAAAKALEVQLKNTGYQFSAPDIELYITNLQNMSGVLDDQLRPAFQSLLTASGSLIQSQKALAIALDVSAATGKSVEEVTNAMSKGFSGQTGSLGKLNAGLDKATLASGDMNLILDELGNKFSGQAQARLETYAGKMDLLNVGVQEATKSIGKGLVDALMLLGKDTSIEQTRSKIEGLGITLGNLIAGFGALLSKLNSLDKATGVSKFLNWLDEKGPVGMLARLGAKSTAKLNAPKSNFTYGLGTGAGTEIAKAKELLLVKKTNAARAKELAALNAKSAVDALKDKFDLERIGLTAALNAATDDEIKLKKQYQLAITDEDRARILSQLGIVKETELRLNSQMAILDNNEALAKKYLAEMEAAKAATNLATSFNTAHDALMAEISKWQNQALSMFAAFDAKLAAKGMAPVLNTLTASPSSGGGGTVAAPFTGSIAELSSTLNFINNAAQDEKIGKASSYVINIDATSMIDPANMTKVVQQAFIDINKNGYSTTPAGQGF